jgi:dihydropteroate synthase/2-amino-4-hydroxy-6-hydroxymethyldihydropteridine diphosphokinase
MRVYLGLGSNLGDRRSHLSRAIDALEAHGLAIVRVSPVVESPALLPDSAPSDWNLPYLNLVLECAARCSAEQLRIWIDEIQQAFGRHGKSHWSPRPIDIDILLWGRERIQTERLTIPHGDLTCRSFVLAPLVALEPRLTIPGRGERMVLDYSMALDQHIPLWMGIVNVTPDSFSGDGLAQDGLESSEETVAAALRKGLEFQEAGADFLDIGAESTRPGNQPIPAQEELDRLMPPLEALARNLTIPIAVDTYKSSVAREALRAGASIVNDVWGLKQDPALASVTAEAGGFLVVMHNQERAIYRDLLPDILESLKESCQHAVEAGVSQEKIILDPGIGFGKTPEQNLEILRRLDEFKTPGFPLLVGVSRKSTIGRVLHRPVEQRLHGTSAAVTLAIAGGADIVRVHDVTEMVQVSRMADAVVRGWRPDGWKA